MADRFERRRLYEEITGIHTVERHARKAKDPTAERSRWNMKTRRMKIKEHVRPL